MSKAQNSKPYDLKILDSIVEKPKLPFEFYILDLFRIWSLVFRV